MKHPTLYQINTRFLLQERGVGLGRAATLDDVPDSLLDRYRRAGIRLRLVSWGLADRPCWGSKFLEPTGNFAPPVLTVCRI